jgi:hypothetical protein
MTRWKRKSRSVAATTGLCTLLQLLNPVTLERVLPASSADDRQLSPSQVFAHLDPSCHAMPPTMPLK